MKKVLVLALVILMTFSLAGCGVKDKIEQKVTEKVVEKVIESAAGDENTEVDLSEGKITFKGEDGGTVVFGGTQWPDDIDIIPEFTEGNVVSVIKDNESNAMIALDEVAQEDFEDYLADLKGVFTENVMEMNVDNVFAFSGQDSKGNFIQITYDFNGESVTILTTKGEN